MVTKKEPYKPASEYLMLDPKRKLGMIKCIKKQISKFDLTTEELGLKQLKKCTLVRIL